MEPIEFLQYASTIAASPRRKAAEYRSAISRAYYAIFLAARRFIVDELGFRSTSGNDHQWVQRHFYNCAKVDAKTLARLLQSLHDARKAADYDMNDVLVESQQQAMFQCMQADRARGLLDACVEDLKQIKEEMLEYRRRAGL